MDRHTILLRKLARSAPKVKKSYRPLHYGWKSLVL